MPLVRQLGGSRRFGAFALPDLRLRSSVRDVDLELDEEFHDVLPLGPCTDSTMYSSSSGVVSGKVASGSAQGGLVAARREVLRRRRDAPPRQAARAGDARHPGAHQVERARASVWLIQRLLPAVPGPPR